MALQNNFASAILGRYDKLIAIAGVAVLGVGAFLFAAERIDGRKDAAAFQGKITALKPAHSDVADVSLQLSAYAVQLSRIAKPLQIPPVPERKAGFFVPEVRVWCVKNDCRHPLDPECEKCPICGTEQVVKPITDVNVDSDCDGMPDEWERKYGFNPQDPSDAALDSDEDGFTNLQEFLDGTDPHDAKSHKDFATLLRVRKITASILPIKFSGSSRMPNGHYKCAFNVFTEDPVTKRRNFATLWVDEGARIANPDQKVDTGFKLLSLNRSEEERFDPITESKRKFEVQTVTIAKEGKTFTLELDKTTHDTDSVITLAKDFGDKGEITVVERQEFKIGDKIYRVVKVNRETMEVVIRCDADKSEVALTRDGALK